MQQKVILVDEDDSFIGIEEKIKAHRKGLLHRAFSIFIFNSHGDLLIQQRAHNKYHSAGLWSNTCCSHPRPGESVLEAARLRLKEEMGFQAELFEVFSFIYNGEVGKNIFENEFDHVLVGKYIGEPVPNSKEVAAWKWISPGQAKVDIELHPDSYTLWFKAIIDRVLPFSAGLSTIEESKLGQEDMACIVNEAFIF